jgi:2-keto-4-pentenoate hydratase/2-oxohepta-3-ene-1,7-dioic acid hydratase in catechol pathway
MSPWITPRSAVVDPNDLSINLMVNGEIKQDSSSSEMLFKCEAHIAYLGRHITLYSGDGVATGTPAGYGMPHNTFLEPGDTMTVQVASLGELCNAVI